MQVSVVVNVHQGMDFNQFRDTSASILEQTYDNIEFIVVVSDVPDLASGIKDFCGMEAVLS